MSESRFIPGIWTVCLALVILGFSCGSGLCEKRDTFSYLKYSFHQLPKNPNTEALCFWFNLDFLPKVHSISGKRPKLYFDLEPVNRPLLDQNIPIQGLFILKIRSYLHQSEDRFRIVVDLKKDFDYHVQQRYLQGQKRFCLIVQSLSE